MGALLERARQALGGGPVELPPAEPFEIRCACGAKVTGFRLDSRQFVPCSGCQRRLFVLPTSAYPKPIVREARPATAALPVDVVAPKPPLSERFGQVVDRSRRGLAAALWALVPPARWFSPVRLVMMGMVLVIAGTVYLTIQLSRRGSLTGDFLAARAEWMQHLEAGEFGQARQLLEEAAASLRRYGSDQRQVREVEQLAKEIGLFADLADRSIADLVQDVRTRSGGGASADYFRDTLHNPALIVDAHVSPADEASAQAALFRVESQLAAGNEFVRFDLAGFDLVEKIAPTATTRLIFAARIMSIERSATIDEWIVRFVPESGALITSPEALSQLGWPLDESTRSVIQAQAASVLED